MRYTAQDDPRIDAKVEADLDVIQREILNLLNGHAKAILLTGGFGRGEGSVDLSVGGVRILNDYDLAILLEASNHWHYLRLFRRYHQALQTLAEHLAKQLGMKQVDLMLRPYSYFTGHPPLRIENYEVKHGHRLLHGRADPCDLMPDWRPEDIPWFEGTWLFRNRGLGLLIAAAYFNETGQVAQRDRENLVIECIKAQLAMGDAVLLLNRRYHHSYAERARRICSLPWADVPDGEALRQHYSEALEQKLRPDFGRLDTRDVRVWWSEITRLFDRIFRYFESQRLGAHFADWLEYEQLEKPENRLDLRTWVWGAVEAGPRLLLPSVWRRNLLKARKSRTIAAMALLLFARLEGPHRSRYLARAAQLLAEPCTGSFERDWSELTGKFLLLIHPDGEAGCVARELLPVGAKASGRS
jgi:hypothetical protein